MAGENRGQRPADCPRCGQEGFQRLARHWEQSCAYPELTERHRQVVRGMHFASGEISEGVRRAVGVRSIRKPFVEWVADQLGWLGTRVHVRRFDDGEVPTVYHVKTRRHPTVDTMIDERPYEPMEPLVAKIAHVSRGSLRFESGRTDAAGASLYLGRWRDEAERVQAAFENVDAVEKGFVPRVRVNGSLYFGVWDTTRYLPWLGEPVPGHEFLWENNSRMRYDHLKATTDGGRTRRNDY